MGSEMCIRDSTNDVPWYQNRIFLASALVGVGGVVGYVSAESLNSLKIDDVPEGGTIAEPDAEEPAEDGKLIDFTSDLPCGHPADNLTFKEAFKSQRELMGPGGVFEYRGQYYNTFYKEEWETMTDSQKNDYYLAIDDKIDYDKSTIVNISKGQKQSISLGDYNNGSTGINVDPFIPEHQENDYIAFEYGDGHMESGPNNSHLGMDMEVPETIIIENTSSFRAGSYEMMEVNNSSDDDELWSDNSSGEEYIAYHSSTHEQVVDIDSSHLVSGVEDITIIEDDDLMDVSDSARYNNYTDGDTDDVFDATDNIETAFDELPDDDGLDL